MQIATSKISNNDKKAMLLEILAQLSKKEQREIHHLLGQWLNKKTPKVPALKKFLITNNDFLQTEFGQYILEEADDKIPIAKVRKALSKITGSLANEINEDREER